jgi:hypothetical protein
MLGQCRREITVRAFGLGRSYAPSPQNQGACSAPAELHTKGASRHVSTHRLRRGCSVPRPPPNEPRTSPAPLKPDRPLCLLSQPQVRILIPQSQRLERRPVRTANQLASGLRPKFGLLLPTRETSKSQSRALSAPRGSNSKPLS